MRPPAKYNLTVRRWQKQYWVVLVRAIADSRSGTAALGIYANGDKPIPARKLASSGAMEAKEDLLFEQLDLANFRVSKSEIAIGVWLKRRRGYAGGFGEADILSLFLRRGANLTEIFSKTMRYDCDLAGDWNEDGSRDRTGANGESVLVVDRKMTDSYFDLVQRSGKNPIEVFQWRGDGYIGSPPTGKRSKGERWGNDCKVTHDYD